MGTFEVTIGFYLILYLYHSMIMIYQMILWTVSLRLVEWAKKWMVKLDTGF